MDGAPTLRLVLMGLVFGKLFDVIGILFGSTLLLLLGMALGCNFGMMFSAVTGH